MRTVSFVAATAAATVALVGLAAAPAAAARPIRAAAKTQLVLTYAAGEKASPVQRRAVLTCAPAGGTHQQAKAACTALNAAHGDPAALVPSDGMCTMQYDPVTVTATGRWHGKIVRYKHTFGNACVLRTDTGAVFAL
jgi:hypothetical protein